MISADLTGKTALITGGVSGIGLAAVELFARTGAAVAANHLPDDPGAEQVLQELRAEGLNVVAAPGDVGDGEAARQMVRRAAEALGRLDYLINNAGTPGTPEPIDFRDLDQMTEAFWQRLLSVNLLGPFRCTQAAVGYLKAARGAVVNTASIAGLRSRGSSIAYGATKAALINLTRNLARALAPEVRVNAVAPGFVETPWTRDWPPRWRENAQAHALLGRTCRPEDIAEAMLFLCAAEAPITAHTLVVDAGYQDASHQ